MPPRKLAVILHADVVGSTTLVHLDETVAHERIRGTFLRFSETINGFGGTAHEIRGDALVAEFARASDAVSASLTFQAENSVQNETYSNEIRPEVRIGISMGEIVVADGTLTGEGVVLAQRLEQMAPKGGVCIQGAAYETIPRRLPFDYINLGEQQLKGFEQTYKVYEVRLKQGSTIPMFETQEKKETGTRLLPDKPSIAVLPFTNMSGDQEQEYFSDGISEDIITALSRMPWFLVIARNSSFVYKGSAIDITEVARELAVQYVLEGSVRKSGNRVRITAQLIDATTDKHVWAGRYDRELADVFAVQDEVVESIVGEVAPEFLSAEARRARHANPAQLNAWDLVMRGRWHMWRLGRSDIAQARALFEQAIDSVSSGEFGASDLALTHLFEAYYNWTDSRDDSLQAMLGHAEHAAAVDDRDVWAHTILSITKVFLHDWEDVLPPLDHAIALNPNFAPALGARCIALACLGESDRALEVYEQAVRLSPHDSLIPLWLIGKFWAQWSLEDYRPALNSAKEIVRLAPGNPTGRRQIAAAYVAIGELDKARQAFSDYREIEPDQTAADVLERLPSNNPEPLNRFVDALRLVGLPG